MTDVRGKIESLTYIRSELDRQGITRFNSIAELRAFNRSYDQEKARIKHEVEAELDREIEALRADRIKLQEARDSIYKRAAKQLSQQLEELEQGVSEKQNISGNWLRRGAAFVQSLMLQKKIRRIQEGFQQHIDAQTREASDRLRGANNLLTHYHTKRAEVLAQRNAPKLEELQRTKMAVDRLKTAVLGAFGEHKVVSVLKDLSGPAVLLNDFRLRFDPPLLYHKELYRIFGIQIDHLLITRAGLFVLETKNWSKASIEKLDLRSPVEQIQRSGFALYKLLHNSPEDLAVPLNSHHWGKRSIPIRNVVAMIHHKPPVAFQNVAVKTLNELNGYIEYFEPVMNADEVLQLADYLEELQHTTLNGRELQA
jgi:hypothetical protein